LGEFDAAPIAKRGRAIPLFDGKQSTGLRHDGKRVQDCTDKKGKSMQLCAQTYLWAVAVDESSKVAG
jgi:hypothetical protein